MPTPRTVNDIIPPSRRRQMNDVGVQGEGTVMDMPATIPPTPAPPPMRPLPVSSRGGFPWGTALIALVVIASSIGALMLFSGAKVELIPRVVTGQVSAELTATPDSGELPFKMVSAEKIATKSVPAESTVNANDAAEGTITVYNTGSAPQRFVKNTRFESPTGLIFRARDAVNVPAGSAGAPGTVTISVYAETGGEQYNIAPTDFTLPGLKGTPEAALVYGKSTSAFTGGFLGNRPSVSEATATRERSGLQTALASEILTALRAALPAGYVLVPGTETIVYTPMPDAPDGNGGVAVRHKATATAAAFPEEAFSRAIAQRVIGQPYAGQPVRLAGVDQLRATPERAVVGTEPFTFALSGSATVIWEVDPLKVAGSIAGKTKKAAIDVISSLPELEIGTKITLRPFWSSTLPSDPTEIEVVVEETSN